MSQVNVKAVISAEDKTGAVLRGFESKISKLGTSALHLARNMALVGGAAVAAGAAFSLKAAADFEQTAIAFNTMIGDADKAKKMLKEMSEFAAKTPFTLPEVEAGAKQLLAMGSSTDTLLGEMKMLGDVSAGLSVPMERLVLNFGQVRTQGKLTGRELRDFNVAGVPIIAELAKNLKVSKDDIAKMVEKGKIGFDDVSKAFKTMTSDGGKFENLMDKQSKTFSGVVSNLKDNAVRLARDLMGITEEGMIKEGSLFWYIKRGGQSLLKWLDRNRQKIINAATRIVEGLVKTVKGAAGFFKDAWKELEKPLKDLWRRIKDDLIPALSDLYKNYIEPMIPIIRDVLVGAFKLLIEILGKLATFVAEHKNEILGLIATWVVLKAAMKIDSVVTSVINGIKLMMAQYTAFNIQAGTNIGGVKGALKNLKAYMGGPMGAGFMALRAVGIAALAAIAMKAIEVMGTLNQTKQALGIFNAEQAKIDSKIMALMKKKQTKGLTKKEEASLEHLIKTQQAAAIGAKEISDAQGGVWGSWTKDVLSFKNLFKATGGTFDKGDTMMVGEQGPEMITAGRSGRVIPNHQLSGGGSVNLTVNIGSFSGSAIERRKLAKQLYNDLRTMGLAV